MHVNKWRFGMDLTIGKVLACATMLAVLYAHRKIPAFTHSKGKTLFSHAMLIVVGIAFGAVSSFYVVQTAEKLIAFLSAFGAVHIPAAVILFVKSRRGETPS